MIYVKKYDRHVKVWYEMNMISGQNALNKKLQRTMPQGQEHKTCVWLTTK